MQQSAKLHSIRKMRSGDLLVEVSSRKQAQQIQKLKSLATIRVSVTPPQSPLNSSKGVITWGEILNLPVELIVSEMKSQGVTHVRRISIRRDGQLLETKHHVLTFKTSKLPEYVYAGYIKLPVRPYIPNPLGCFQCQRFGHSKMNCCGSLTCARCAQKGNDSQQCTAEEKCVNCGGDHPSYSRSCPRWALEKQVTTIKFKEDLSYPEARRRVKAQTQFLVKTTDNEKTSDSDAEHTLKTNTDTQKIVRRKSKSQTSLTLNLAKRGLTQKDLRKKLKNSASKNSVALGLATQGVVHKDLQSIFGDTLNSPDIKLHPSEDEYELGMSCDDHANSTTASSLSPPKSLS
ncbi:uncharacterized protein LOC129975499 [Argiope bruennichi]|uniref:uncharacterized protein LOC129975499 n=1 Tax=Argiope bruennichi TaxID=94029 RepID=UPI0024949DB8|nr:uncharacterized protein LOC129975499 [Argiope bruennichi]